MLNRSTAYDPASTNDDMVTLDVKIDPANLTEAQKAAHSVRFPKLDQESVMNFTEGFKKWLSSDREWIKALEPRMAARGVNMRGETNLGYEEAFDTLIQDPVFAARTRLQWSSQDLMWDRTMRALHGDADKYLSAMEATDNAGPGSLELNPDMEIPHYTRYEIHRQPGGFVGDPFAGWAYNFALTEAFYLGRSKHDEMHTGLAQSHPKPADGVVRRVLDIGCSSGMTTTAYKERFPNAEVWGIDIGGPMVRYAHYRAVQLGLDVHFAQRLAEDTKFPDNYFDMINDFFIFHEVDEQAVDKIAAEMFRILRPGGNWKHNDIITQGNPGLPVDNSIYGKARAWDTHRHNYEPWWLERLECDFPEVLRRAGFEVDMPGATSSQGGGATVPLIVATKPL
jgi:SAM-dependent methyltransferase